MRIGEVARAAGVSTQALRFYERLGLVRPTGRSRAGYRCYDERAIMAVQFIKAAQSLGFTLAEIRAIAREAGGMPGPVALRTAADGKRAKIRRRIEDLRALDEKIEQLLRACGCDSGQPCTAVNRLRASLPLK